MIETIIAIIFVFIVVAACCSSDSDTTNSTSNTYQSRNVNTRRTSGSYPPSSYSECPCCGAPGYDGYCEDCGYPDINQGWIGENY